MDQQLQKKKIMEILNISENLNRIKDVDSMLDRVLMEVRLLTHADAGSIFLKKGDKLSFEHVHNDTLMKNDTSRNRYIYAKQEIPINSNSIAGYVAAHKTHLVIDDVYKLNSSVPYTFNHSFDDSSSYHTQSVLTVPLMIGQDKLIGVIQLINPKDKRGEVIPFSTYDELLVTLFANQAAAAIERAQMTREIILRMIKIAEMRDPKETGEHVNRVASYSIEIYQRWASKKIISHDEVKQFKDLLRIASMLHDVGKVGISDNILKKRDTLDEFEREIMKKHTVYGARLFKDSTSDWDDMAKEITLNHHEKWDGSGYPGFIGNIFHDPICIGPGKNREEIPLSARIVSLADIYDALISPRSYKNCWSEQKVIDYILDNKGKFFDPEIVDAFFDIYDVIKAIRQKYSDSD